MEYQHSFQMNSNETEIVYRIVTATYLVQSSYLFSAMPLDTSPDTFHFISFQLKYTDVDSYLNVVAGNGT